MERPIASRSFDRLDRQDERIDASDPPSAGDAGLVGAARRANDLIEIDIANMATAIG